VNAPIAASFVVGGDPEPTPVRRRHDLVEDAIWKSGDRMNHGNLLTRLSGPRTFSALLGRFPFRAQVYYLQMTSTL
jgi:hypothetical protein